MQERGGARVAIDGNSGAGKSTLGALLAAVYGGNLYHMDDFFLPQERKTAQRLAEPGGNVDRERFQAEVLSHLGAPFSYRPWRCHPGAFAAPVAASPRAVEIVEGVYSLHPDLRAAYDLRVFLAIAPRAQAERIRARSGEAMLKRFVSEWIPLENVYFDRLGVRECCQLVFSQGRRSEPLRRLHARFVPAKVKFTFPAHARPSRSISITSEMRLGGFFMAISVLKQALEIEELVGSRQGQALLRAEAIVPGAGRDAIETLMAEADLVIGQVDVQEGRVVLEGTAHCQAVYRQGGRRFAARTDGAGAAQPTPSSFPARPETCPAASPARSSMWRPDMKTATWSFWSAWG